MSRFDDARGRFEDAAQALNALRREAGEPETPEGEQAAAAGLRAALEAARRALEDQSRARAAAEARVRELERERDELLRSAATAKPDPAAAEKAQKAESELLALKRQTAAEGAALNGRLSLQQAEMVRLDSLRRKAEESVQQAELTRRQVEESLRREIRSAHAALDRAAAEAGAREARVQTDIQGLQRRLDAALTRTEQLSREQRVERERWRGERERLASTLQRASAVHASLRREIAELRGAQDARAEDLANRLKAAESELNTARQGLPPSEPKRGRRAADLSESAATAAMVARLRPAAAAAYERLRELSAVVPLSEAEAASLRRAASAVSGLSDAVTVVERYLDDGPPGEPGALEPAFKRAQAEWDAAFHRKGTKLTFSFASGLPTGSFDGPDLKLLLDQLLRRAFEILPAKGRLDVTLERAAGGIEAHFTDDQPLTGSKAAQAFEPGPDLRSLALPMARRMMRRWGGEARMEKTSSGTGRLVLYFAVPA